MSVRFDQPVPLQRLPGRRLPDLRWPIGLAGAGGLPFLLPLESPAGFAALAGFVALMVVLAFGWLVALLPVLAVLGAYFLPVEAMGVNVFGFRLLIMLLALFSTPLTTRVEWWSNLAAQRAVLFMVFWMLWGLLSLFWTPDPGAGLGDVMTLVFGLGLILILFSLNAHRNERLDKLRFGWLIGLILAAVMAGIELATGYHLPSFASTNATHYFDGSVVQSTIGHPSAFGGYLLLVVPFVLWSVERTTGFARIFHLALLAVIAVLVVLSASRLALGGLVLQLGFYVVVLQRRRWYMPFLVALGTLGLIALYSTVMESESQMASKLAKAETGEDSSISHRFALTLNALWLVYETGGRGIGAAAFESHTLRHDLPVALPIHKRTGWEAHNMWAEILSEYGILTFAILTAFLGWIAWLGWRAQRRARTRPDDDTPTLGRAVLVGLIGYLFFGVTSGSVFIQSVHWMFLASLLVMGAALYARLAAAYQARRAPVEPAPSGRRDAGTSPRDGPSLAPRDPLGAGSRSGDADRCRPAG